MALGIGTYDTRDTGSQPDPEARLAEAGRAAGPLRRVAAALARRMLERRGEGGEAGWERLGFGSVGDYARERLGLSASSLTEWARVGRRLEALPHLEAALVSGALAWSKVRLLARFVQPEDEAPWIAHARATAVRRLEREVRAVARGALEAGAGGGPAARGAHEMREAHEWVHVRGPASLSLGWLRLKGAAARVAGQRLTAGAVLEMVTAETLSALPLDPEGVAPLEAQEQRASEAAATSVDEVAAPDLEPLPIEAADAGTTPELPVFLRPLVAGLEDADAFELDARLRRVVHLEQRLDAEVGRLLRQVTASEYEWQGEPRTLAGIAREQLGMSPRKARALLRLERAADACAELRAAYRDGAISWLRAQILIPLMGGEPWPDGPWRAAWVAMAGRVSVRRLEELVELALALRQHEPDRWARVCGAPMQLVRDLGPGAGDVAACCASGDSDGTASCGPSGERQVCVAPTLAGETWRVGILAPASIARLFRATLCSVRRATERSTGRLPSEAEAFEAMMAHALQSWGIDEPWLARRMRRLSPVFERDGWRCSVPGCSSRRNLHAHHIVFRSAGGSDDPSNLTTLCAVHHQRGVHAGRVQVRGKAPDGLTFELGLRPGLPPLERYRSGDLVA